MSAVKIKYHMCHKQSKHKLAFADEVASEKFPRAHVADTHLISSANKRARTNIVYFVNLVFFPRISDLFNSNLVI